MAIQRVWKAHGLQPHRLETFKLSRDKQFVEKLRDVVGLLNPPEHALVLSVDEKSQIQALDRSQPGLPLKKGRAGTVFRQFVIFYGLYTVLQLRCLLGAFVFVHADTVDLVSALGKLQQEARRVLAVPDPGLQPATALTS